MFRILKWIVLSVLLAIVLVGTIVFSGRKLIQGNTIKNNKLEMDNTIINQVESK